MPVSSGLTAALKKLVLTLQDDLRARVEEQPPIRAEWSAQHRAAVDKERTGLSWQEWRDDRVTQAAVAWVLTTVFVRFCEDNGLLKPVWIFGPPARRQEALDAELQYFRENPEHTDREWLLESIGHLKEVKATRDLVEAHSPLWSVSPSGQAVKVLISFWRSKTSAGDLVWDFTDPALSTRFLGDLYQDLSDHAKKTYALLQTPAFVEEFILDQTMEPALAERPLDGFRLIDPTCGSGHFLLGAFARLNERWARQAPDLEPRERVRRALEAVHGVDLNAFAVAIARFRLMVAALQAVELRSLEDAPAWHFNLVAGDSLLHGEPTDSLLPDFDVDAARTGEAFDPDDLAALRKLLQPNSYDVVVGNPPYITVKDKTLNTVYRRLYSTCKGTYALTVPFMERFFQLAKQPSGDRPVGWVGQITSNSFMKREFGSRLIEEFLVKQDLRLVADTSGAYIPGHGTPTVILVGRAQPPVGSTVKAVLGVRGEPGQPADPAHGLVWSTIVEHVGDPDFANEYVSIGQLSRLAFARHPWSLSGGGAAGVIAALDGAPSRLALRLDGRIGFASFPGSDDCFFSTRSELLRRCGEQLVKRVITGDVVRDWVAPGGDWAFFPYDTSGQLISLDQSAGWAERQWAYRTVLGAVKGFGGETRSASGAAWWAWYRMVPNRYATPLSIAFAFVATHNHFVLDRGGKVFNRSAPVIKLREGATEDDHLRLVGVLNSSTACFWLKQHSHNKGNGGIGGGIGDEGWEPRYEFTGTTLQDFPLPERLPLERARALDAAARLITERFAAAVPDDGTPTAGGLEGARLSIEAIRARMVHLQEELDWEVYRAYGLIDEDLTCSAADHPGLRLGERAFEIALAHRTAAGGEQTAWFTRHRSTPVVDLPEHWPPAYQKLVRRRLDLIAEHPFIGLLERPENKRRWASKPWDGQVERALRGWLLDRLEQQRFWFDAQRRPVARSVAQLADVVSREPDLVSVLELWSGRRDQSVTQQLSALLDGESVPFLAAYRLKESGMRKREVWEHTWELQRREDAGEQVGDIPVPPKYTTADFRRTAWWQHRGKLDVPKERFILYPAASRETDPTALVGWAGWDHAQQALALATVLGERQDEGWSDERLVPLVAGLAELQPWVRQWHDVLDPTYGVNLADFLDEELRNREGQVQQTVEQLKAWRPQAATRRRKART